MMISQIKSIDLGNDQPFTFSLCPNPSHGIIGIKFDTNKPGKILVSVTNVHGQTILNKLIEITDDNYRQKAIYKGRVMAGDGGRYESEILC